MPAENLPEKIGPYQIVGLLGRGGMGAVYKAFKPPLTKRFVAVKIIKAEFISTPGALERFRREAALASELKHPNIVTVYDYEEVPGGDSYIITELIEGGQTLKDRLLQGGLSLSEISDMVKQVASALDYAYESHHIVHRDIKPSNIFIDGKRIALGDFGIAKDVSANTQLTSMGEGVGTPDYMSPEQAMGEPLDRRSDIYSLGIMAFEMLTGSVPFKGDTPISVVMGHIQKPVPAIHSINPSIPFSLEGVLIKALAKKKDERYATAGDFATAFETAAKGLPGEATLISSRPAQNIAESAASQNEANAVSQGLNLVGMLESQGRYQDAFDQLAKLQQQHPQATQITSRYQSYANQGYRASVSNFNTTPSGLGNYNNGANVSNYQAGYSNQNSQNTQYAPNGIRTATPPPGSFTPYPNNGGGLPPEKKKSPLPLLIGGGVAVLVVVGIILAVVVGGSKSPQPTTVVVVVPTNTVPPAPATPTKGAATTAATTTVSGNGGNANNKLSPEPVSTVALTSDSSSISTPTNSPNDQAAQLNKDGNALYDSGDYNGASAKYAQAVKLKPDEPIYHNNLGLTYLKQTKYDLAENEERLAISLDPNKADYHNNLGVSLYRLGKNSDAEQEYRAAIRLNTKISLYHSNLATTLDDEGTYPEAATEAQTAISLDPKNASAYSALGQTFQYGSTPDYVQAEQNYRKALSYVPSSAIYNYELAEALYDEQKYTEAETFARKAVSLDPKSARAQDSLGLALEGEKNYAGSASAYRAATVLDSKQATYFRNLAHVLDLQKQYSDAQTAIKAALSLEPDNARGNAIQGDVYYDQSDYKDALTYYQKAATNDDQNANYYVDVGDSYYQLKDNVNAKKYYQQALQIDPNNTYAQDGLNKVGG